MTLYSLCRRLRGNKGGRWERIGKTAHTKAIAVTVFQNDLLANAFGLLDGEWEYQLRVVSVPQRTLGATL